MNALRNIFAIPAQLCALKVKTINAKMSQEQFVITFYIALD